MYGVTTKSGCCQRPSQAVSRLSTPACPSLPPDGPLATRRRLPQLWVRLPVAALYDMTTWPPKLPDQSLGSMGG